MSAARVVAHEAAGNLHGGAGGTAVDARHGAAVKGEVLLQQRGGNQVEFYEQAFDSSQLLKN